LRQARSEPRELKKRGRWEEERTSGGGDGHPFATPLTGGTTSAVMTSTPTEFPDRRSSEGQWRQKMRRRRRRREGGREEEGLNVGGHQQSEAMTPNSCSFDRKDLSIEISGIISVATTSPHTEFPGQRSGGLFRRSGDGYGCRTKAAIMVCDRDFFVQKGGRRRRRR
jgi:hypothetical protein